MTNTNAPQITIQPLKRSTIQPRKHCAFTLAEVLITLAIIGIVAALTIPSLISEIQDKHFITKWEKTYATIAGSAYLGSNEYDLCDKVGWQECTREQILATYKQVISNLSLADACSVRHYERLEIRPCKRNEFKHIQDGSVKCKSLSGDFDGHCRSDADGLIAILKDGSWLYFAGPYWDAPKILIDVNGPVPPNTIGRDMFTVQVVKGRVIPTGASEFRSNLNNCSKNAVSSLLFGEIPLSTTLSGSSCSNKYLHKK